MDIKYFNIHNIVKFKINDAQKLILKDLFGDPFEEYSNYKSEEIAEENLDLIFNICTKIDKKIGCYILDDKYYIDQGYIYTNDSYKIAKWSIEIINKNQKTYILNIKPNRIARLFISGFFIDFFIQYILTKKGYSIIHSSGVSQNGKSYLFSGRGGSGKTSIALHIINTGESFQFLGDDFIIIKNGLTLPYITPLNLFTYNINSSIKAKFNKKQKFSFILKNFVFKLSFGYAKFFTRFNPIEHFFDRISPGAELSNIYILIPTNQENVTEIDIIPLEKREIIKHLVLNLKMDSWYIPKYFIQYGFLFPNDEYSRYWQNYENTLIENLPESKNYSKIIVPKSVAWQKLFNTIKKEFL